MNGYSPANRANAKNQIPGSDINAQYVRLQLTDPEVLSIRDDTGFLHLIWDTFNAVCNAYDPIIINNTSDTLAPNKGALQVLGGMFLGGKAWINDGTTGASLGATCALIVQGGASIAKDLWVGTLHATTLALGFPANRMLFGKSDGSGSIDTDSPFTYTKSTATLAIPHVSGTDYTGHVIGNADTSTTATSANNINSQNDSTTNALVYPAFHHLSTSGNQVPYISSNIAMNPNIGSINVDDGSSSNPAQSWLNETDSGWVRKASKSFSYYINATEILNLLKTLITFIKPILVSDTTASTSYTTGCAVFDGGVGIAGDLWVNGTTHGTFNGDATDVTVTNNTSDTNDQIMFANGTGQQAPQSNASLAGDLSRGNLIANNMWSLVNRNPTKYPMTPSSVVDNGGGTYTFTAPTDMVHCLETGQTVKLAGFTVTGFPPGVLNTTWTITVTSSTTFTINIGSDGGNVTVIGTVLAQYLVFDVSGLTPNGRYRLEADGVEYSVSSNTKVRVYQGSWITSSTYNYSGIYMTSAGPATVNGYGSSSDTSILAIVNIQAGGTFNLDFTKHTLSTNSSSHYFTLIGEGQASDRGAKLLYSNNGGTAETTKFRIAPDGGGAYVNAGTFRLYKKSY
jgi:hypothetical protein